MKKLTVILGLALLGIVITFANSHIPQVFAASPTYTQESAKAKALTYGPEYSFSGGIILSHYSRIDLTPKGDANIAETIIVYFPVARHGITRYIPQKIKLDNGSTLKTPITNVDVSYKRLPSEQGSLANTQPFSEYSSETTEGGYLFLKIGDPNQTITGAYEYHVSYTMKNAIRFFNDHQELYLNINGNLSDLPTLAVSAEVWPKHETTDLQCFTGNTGSTAHDCTIKKGNNGEILAEATTDFGPNQGLTIGIAYPNGTFTGPSALEKAWAQFIVVVPLLVPIIAAYYAYTTWSKYGKDKSMTAIPPVYVLTEPLKNGELTLMKYLHDMNASQIPFLAEIIKIAEKGLMTVNYEDNKFGISITPEQREKLLEYINTKPDYLIKSMMLFTRNFGEYTQLDTLKNVYDDIQKANQQANKAFQGSELLDKTSVKYRGIMIALMVGAFVIAGGTAFLMFNLEDFSLFTWPLSFGITGMILAMAQHGMLKRTSAGDELYLELLGLKKYIAAAELERLEFFNDPKKMIEHFEQLLPFAIIFGLERKWAAVFGPILEKLKYEPTWYAGNYPVYNAFSHNFYNMSSAFASTATKLATPPSSSSGGFGGGGGFSGGGSGGGGTGSW